MKSLSSGISFLGLMIYLPSSKNSFPHFKMHMDRFFFIYIKKIYLVRIFCKKNVNADQGSSTSWHQRGFCRWREVFVDDGATKLLPLLSNAIIHYSCKKHFTFIRSTTILMRLLCIFSIEL